MKEYISIKNVGPLKDIQNLSIKPFTILIGESGSGKSTLMKLLSMLRFLYKTANIRSYLKHSEITGSSSRMNYDTLLKDNGLRPMITSNSEVIYRVVMDDGKEYVISYKSGKWSALPTISPEHLMYSKVAFVSEQRNVIPMWTQTANRTPGANLGYYFARTNALFSMAIGNYYEYSLDYIGMKLQVIRTRGKAPKMVLSPNNQEHDPIELRSASSGIQTSASVAMIVKYLASADGFSFKPDIDKAVLHYLYENTDELVRFKPINDLAALKKFVQIHIEEPELSLFPDAQCRLIEQLVNTASHCAPDRTLSLIFATHSPYILNYMNILLNQKREGRAKLVHTDMAVYNIYGGTSQNLLMQDKNGRWIVDTYDLSETMNNIYKEFVSL